MSHSIESRLASLGIVLPPISIPQANYIPFVISGNFLFLSGQGPKTPEGAWPRRHRGKHRRPQTGTLVASRRDDGGVEHIGIDLQPLTAPRPTSGRNYSRGGSLSLKPLQERGVNRTDAFHQTAYNDSMAMTCSRAGRCGQRHQLRNARFGANNRWYAHS